MLLLFFLSRLLPPRSTPPYTFLPYTTLLRSVRHIGPTGDDNPAAHIMAISPDGNWVAFHLRRAVPETNRYCLGLVVQSLDGGGARFVDTGGVILLAPAGVTTGSEEPTSELQSPMRIVNADFCLKTNNNNQTY